MSNPTTILAIDTSCDETSVAVVRGQTVLANVIASQAVLHQEYGGVFPTVAKQAHKENLQPAVDKALKQTGLTLGDFDAIAVTQGPGLAPALEVGIRFAEHLATKHQLPLIPINHIEGHVLSVLVEPNRTNSKRTDSKTRSKVEPTFPALTVIVSGGHTEFILVEKIGDYQRLGWTIDDAAGEALDKVGRMLNLGYPAGPVVEEFAQKGDPSRFEFPLPMTTSGDYNLSFSGLKTFARNLIRDLEADNQLDKQTLYDFCASFQYAVFRHISHKLEKVLTDHPEISEVWLGGGVAANISLRKVVRKTTKTVVAHSRKKGGHRTNLTVRVPYTKKLCGDNAAMIGVAANFRAKTATATSQPQLDRKPRWKIDAID